jgi:hypothetical protein
MASHALIPSHVGVLQRGGVVGVLLGVAQASSGCLAVWASAVCRVELRSVMETSPRYRRAMTGGTHPTTCSTTRPPPPSSTTPTPSTPQPPPTSTSEPTAHRPAKDGRGRYRDCRTLPRVEALVGQCRQAVTPVNSRRPTSRSRFATADPLGRVRESHPGAVRAANGTRACRRSHPPVRGPPHARP